MEIIHVPKQTIQIPGKLKRVVQEFAITSRPVSAAEFALFAKRTEYVTAAERGMQEFTVYANPSINEVSYEAWSSMPALFVSRYDVAAFCIYHGVSLPTRSQWAAFVRHVSEKSMFALNAESKNDQLPLGTHFSSLEWLKTRGILGRPPMVQLPGVVPTSSEISDMFVDYDGDSGDISITFRVIVEI